MAGTVGRNKTIGVSNVDSGYTAVGGVKSANWTTTNNTADSTSDDDSGNMTAEYADSQVSGSFTVIYDDTDAGQDELRTAVDAKTKVFLRLRPQDLTGEKEWRFRALLDSQDFTGETGAVEEMTFNFISDGDITYADQ